MPATIIKRDGASVPFDSVKILNAITKANQAVGGEDMSPRTCSSLRKKSAKSWTSAISAAWRKSRMWWKKA